MLKKPNMTITMADKKWASLAILSQLSTAQFDNDDNFDPQVIVEKQMPKPQGDKATVQSNEFPTDNRHEVLQRNASPLLDSRAVAALPLPAIGRTNSLKDVQSPPAAAPPISLLSPSSDFSEGLAANTHTDEAASSMSNVSSPQIIQFSSDQFSSMFSFKPRRLLQNLISSKDDDVDDDDFDAVSDKNEEHKSAHDSESLTSIKVKENIRQTVKSPSKSPPGISEIQLASFEAGEDDVTNRPGHVRKYTIDQDLKFHRRNMSSLSLSRGMSAGSTNASTMLSSQMGFSLAQTGAVQQNGMAFLTYADQAVPLNDISRYATAKRFDIIDTALPKLSDVINPFDVETTRQFIKEVAAAAFAVGLPMHAVEFYAQAAAHRFGERVALTSIATSMWMRFGDESSCHLVQPISAALSLSKMVDVSQIIENVLQGTLTPMEGLHVINAILSRRSFWSTSWLVIPSLTVLSCAAAPLWGGGIPEMFVAAVSGFLMGIFESRMARMALLARGHDLVSGIIANLTVVIANAYIWPIYQTPAVFAGVMWSLPGFRATMAMLDLAMSNYVTGTAKLVSAVITIIQLGIGISAGNQLNTYLGDHALISQPLVSQTSTALVYVCVVIIAMPMMMLLDAKPTHLPQLIAGLIAAFGLSNIFSKLLGSFFGTWLGAFLAGCIGNSYSRITSFPALEMNLFSIMMLVPGSIGLRGVMAGNTFTAVNFFEQMLEVTISIVIGLFSSNFAIPPRTSF